MIEINVVRGGVAIVDDEDGDLREMKWFLKKDGYCEAYRDSQSILLHRVIISRKTGIYLTPKHFVDHINQNKLDNRRGNLRVAIGNSLNGFNRQINKNNSSGFRGVTWRKERKRWRAQIKVNRKAVFLGYFSSPEDAYGAYKKAATLFFGEYADCLK